MPPLRGCCELGIPQAQCPLSRHLQICPRGLAGPWRLRIGRWVEGQAGARWTSLAWFCVLCCHCGCTCCWGDANKQQRPSTRKQSHLLGHRAVFSAATGATSIAYFPGVLKSYALFPTSHVLGNFRLVCRSFQFSFENHVLSLRNRLLNLCVF